MHLEPLHVVKVLSALGHILRIENVRSCGFESDGERTHGSKKGTLAEEDLLKLVAPVANRLEASVLGI